tara:strand:+ start:251 stop:751 length:501 start_codon:yes stop_codon:yes gene_type:complete
MAINATEETRELATTRNNVITVYPFEYVEGMLGAAIASIFHAVDSMRPENQARLSMSRIENVRASAAIVYCEVMDSLSMLEPYHDASLNPKHRLMRSIFRAMALAIDGLGLEKAKTVRHGSALKYAQLMTESLKTIHRVMHPATPPSEREGEVGAFLGTWGPIKSP